MYNYRFTITKTYNYYGYPQARRSYKVESQYFNAEIEYYGNQGYDIPDVECLRKCNGYFWSLHAFMKAFYSGKLDKYFNIKTDESVTFEIEG